MRAIRFGAITIRLAMKKILKTFLLVPIAFVLIVFAIANRHVVKVSLDPLGGPEQTTLAVNAPLFVVLIAAAMVGMLVGGMLTWFSQGRFRKLAREARDEAGRPRRESVAPRSQGAPPDGQPSLPAGG